MHHITRRAWTIAADNPRHITPCIPHYITPYHARYSARAKVIRNNSRNIIKNISKMLSKRVSRMFPDVHRAALLPVAALFSFLLPSLRPRFRRSAALSSLPEAAGRQRIPAADSGGRQQQRPTPAADPTAPGHRAAPGFGLSPPGPLVSGPPRFTLMHLYASGPPLVSVYYFL